MSRLTLRAPMQSPRRLFAGRKRLYRTWPSPPLFLSFLFLQEFFPEKVTFFSFRFVPLKDNHTSQLKSTEIQLTAGTVLLLDETALEEGKLNDFGFNFSFSHLSKLAEN